MTMTKTTHFGSNRSYGLSKAILVYSDGQEAFATVHEPRDSPDGGPPYLGAGEPLTMDFLRQLTKGLGQTVQREILPANLLARARPNRLVDQAAATRHVLQRLQRRPNAERPSRSPAAPGLQSMRI